MSRKVKAVYLCAALLVCGALMSFSSNIPESKFPIPKSAEEKLINIAVSHGAISEQEGVFLVENHAIQQCVDAFVNSGYEPSAAVDKLAELGVSSGEFKTKDETKQEIKKTVEKARKKESNWSKLYRLLGL